MNDKSTKYVIYLVGALIITFVSLPLIHTYCAVGIINNEFFINLERFSFLNIKKDELKYVIFILFFYSICYWSTIDNKKYMQGKEHGSAEWAKYKDAAQYTDKKSYSNNIILTKTEKISQDIRVPGMNLNVLVIGGSGTGKTRFFLKPNILQMNSSFVVTDPKGEVLRSVGNVLIKNGYKVRCLNLMDMEKSNNYNPFHYLRENRDEDVFTLIDVIIKNTTGESRGGDKFWEDAEKLFLQSIFFYLIYEAPKHQQNLSMVMELIRAAEVKEEMEDYKSPLDYLFEELEKEGKSTHIALIQYKHFKVAAGKTAKSIIISAAARLSVYNINRVAKFSSSDEMQLSTVGEEKTALFIVTPPTSTTYNFIAAMMYTQLFSELDYIANWKYDGVLPVKVKFLLDEFANIGKIPNFEKILAYARSLGLSICPIFQSVGQLKEMYKDSFEGIIDNCSSILFLGGQGQSTTDMISKMLGKSTIYTKNTGRTRSRQASTSINTNSMGRDLLTPDEIRILDSKKCILFVKGLKPFLSEKYDLTKHPNYKNTYDYNKKNSFVHKKEAKEDDAGFYNSNKEQNNLYSIKDLEIADVDNLIYEYENEENEHEIN